VFGLESGLLCEGCELINNFVETFLRLVSCVHLVDCADHLSDTEGVSKQSVLTGLAFGGECSLETSCVGRQDEKCDVSLGCAGDHVLDEVPVAWCVNDCLSFGFGDEFED